MRFLLPVAFALALSSSSFADNHDKKACACDATCAETCKDGKGAEACKCEACGCAKDGKCPHGKCHHGKDKKIKK